MMDLREAILQHNKSELTTEQFTEIVRENQKAGVFWVPQNKNQSRFGFLHHYLTPKGGFFQGTLKKHILRAIDKAHTKGITDTDIRYLSIAINTIHFSWRTMYDRDAFVYLDPRLKELDTYFKSYVGSHLKDECPYTHEFMFKTIDLILGMAKEDTYYRARLMDFAYQFRKVYPNRDIPISFDTFEQFTREYIATKFQNAFPYKHNFMTQLVDIMVSTSKQNDIVLNLINDYRLHFPDMLLAPMEIDNINRWH